MRFSRLKSTLAVAFLAAALVAGSAVPASAAPAGNQYNAPKEPTCTGLVIKNCQARDQWRKLRTQAVNLKNVQSLLVTAYVPLFTPAPGKKASGAQTNLRAAYNGAYDRLRANPTQQKLNRAKNLALYQMTLNADQDKKFSSVRTFTYIANLDGVAGSRNPAKKATELAINYVRGAQGKRVGVDWTAVTALGLKSIRYNAMCAEFLYIES